MAKPSLVLLDANVIIAAHELRIWPKLVAAVTLVLPSVIAGESKYFIDPATNRHIPIHLDELLSDGTIREVAATVAELSDLLSQFDRVFIDRMNAGEAEALALLIAGRLPDHLFCSGDGPAIRALALLDLSEQGVSLERLLQSVGLGRKVPRHFGENFFQEQLSRGRIERIQGTSLSSTSRFRL